MTDLIPLAPAKLQFQSYGKVAGAQVRMLGPRGRFCVQCAPKDVGRLAVAWGATLPARMQAAVAEGGRASLRLGPDEYYFITPPASAVAIATRLSAAAVQHGFSFVDVSHRSRALLITGRGAAELLAAGCPLDLSDSSFPPGSATRTVLGRVPTTLCRVSARSFFVEFWRSYSNYMMDFLAAAGANPDWDS